jgi:hypothetical protein
VPDALRAAVERTLGAAGRSVRASSAAFGSGPVELLDELARRGREARDELSRRGGEAREEVARRFEPIERRLGSLEQLVRDRAKGRP